jgi:ATP-dependent DNA helicase RecQ
MVHDALEATEHGGLMLGPAARAYLRGEDRISLVVPPKKERRRKRDGSANPVDDPIFDALRACRRDLAKEAGVPPYVIFHDSTLRDMAAIRPKSLRDMALVSGVGTRKLEAYGEAFLAVLKGFG